MKILFKVFPQKSHLNATFPLAGALRDSGHEVIYAGVVQLRSHVEVQGFDYFVQAEDIFPYSEPRPGQPRLTFWNFLKDWRRIRSTAKVNRPRFARGGAFDHLVGTVRPDLILVDSPYTFFALSLYRHKIPFALLESMMKLDRTPGCPPLDTTYVPDGSRFSRLLCALHWRRYFLKRALLGLIGIRVDFDRHFVLKMAGIWGADCTAISFDRYFHLGLRDVPELILSPRALDFPCAPAGNQFYVGTSVDVNRQEVASDFRFARIFDQMVAERRQGRPLVYCSLGTAAWRYEGAERFLHRVVEAACGQGWNLIVAIGNEFSRDSFSRCPANVAVFQVVPQLRVLRQADLMITHGGMNSIAECVRLGVPMLVYPGTDEIDQAGNAARVAYHGVGLKGRLAQESTGALVAKVGQVLGDRSYRQRILLLGASLERDPIIPDRVKALMRRAFPSVAGFGGESKTEPESLLCAAVHRN